MMRLSLFLLFLFSLLNLGLEHPVSAQAPAKFTVSGYVKDEASGEALIGASVYDMRSGKGTATNQFGFYSLTLPADSVTLYFSYVGYRTSQLKLKLQANLTQNMLLKTSQEIKEVEIIADRPQRIEETTQMSSVDIPIEMVKKMPALFGEVDVLKVIQLMPGVQSGGEASTGLY